MVCVEEGHGLHSNTYTTEGKLKWVNPIGDQTPRIACVEASVGKVKVDKIIDCSKLVRVERSIRVHEGDGIPGSLLVRYQRTGKNLDPMATLSFLTKGLTWAPSYSITLTKEKKTLKLDGQASLLCDLPFFNGIPVESVSLVAGQPRVEFEDLCDPLASGDGALAFIEQWNQRKNLENETPYRPLRPRANSEIQDVCLSIDSKKSKTIMNSAIGRNMSRGVMELQSDSFDNVNQSIEEIKEGEKVEDFFYYQLDSVPLRYDRPLSLPFIQHQAEIEYEDTYFLDLDKRVEVATSGEDEKSSVEVLHSITFQNQTGQPLTAAPVSILARDAGAENQGQSKFLVQTMVKFTVEMTRALDIKAIFVIEAEKELKTELLTKAVNWTGKGKQYVDIVTKKGMVTIINTKKTDIKCRIEHVIQGHLGTSNPKPKDVIERTTSSGFELNPKRKAIWEMMVPAEGTGKLQLEYGVKSWKY